MLIQGLRWAILTSVLAVTLAIPHVAKSQYTPPTPSCYYTIEFYNRNRWVTGPVNRECDDRFIPFQWHSPPWGNWGVDSNYGRRRDGFQFPGWHAADGWLQWNSCTTRRAKFRAPNSRFYNQPTSGPRAFTKQQTTLLSRGSRYAAASWPILFPDSSGVTCTNMPATVNTFRNSYMELYELDVEGDDRVVRLNYPEFNVRVACSSGRCFGYSAWQSPTSGTYYATAEIQVRIAVR